MFLVCVLFAYFFQHICNSRFWGVDRMNDILYHFWMADPDENSIMPWDCFVLMEFFRVYCHFLCPF